ncbi:unnamed protein product [Bursaphelenchus xylophilus]|uniref:(pine wood nematode) hypothetical protein n=1 Tax=Bursaphelenchus xylophilus TaxID=6326 RepID=A0A1I7SWZ8_BURXY|nr:unnamed protein product [Bursaphelenchus xylophilus]CAG9100076.1 unnamed protein product [Bursaphelenchus xylophilus]
MHSRLFVFILVASVKADLEQTLKELNGFLSPAGLDSGVMAELGKTIAENEWEEHKQTFADKLPNSNLIAKYAWQLQTVLQYAGVQLCDPCLQYLPTVQEFLRNGGLASYAVEIALCNTFYWYDSSLIPVCDVGLAGLNLYIQNAQPQEICGAIPSCSAKTTKKRSADRFAEGTGRFFRSNFRFPALF